MEVVGTNPCPHRRCPQAHRACSMRAPMRTNAARPWAGAPHGHASAWGLRAGCRARHASAWGVRAGCRARHASAWGVRAGGRARRKPMRLRGACAHGAARKVPTIEVLGAVLCPLGAHAVRPSCPPNAHHARPMRTYGRNAHSTHKSDAKPIF